MYYKDSIWNHPDWILGGIFVFFLAVIIVGIGFPEYIPNIDIAPNSIGGMIKDLMGLAEFFQNLPRAIGL